jgi:hypothetical protein
MRVEQDGTFLREQLSTQSTVRKQARVAFTRLNRAFLDFGEELVIVFGAETGERRGLPDAHESRSRHALRANDGVKTQREPVYMSISGDLPEEVQWDRVSLGNAPAALSHRSLRMKTELPALHSAERRDALGHGRPFVTLATKVTALVLSAGAAPTWIVPAKARLRPP